MSSVDIVASDSISSLFPEKRRYVTLCGEDKGKEII